MNHLGLTDSDADKQGILERVCPTCEQESPMRPPLHKTYLQHINVYL